MASRIRTAAAAGAWHEAFRHATVSAKPAFPERGSAIVSSRRSASFLLVAGALSLACGARSGLECFGESCGRPGDGEGGQQAFDPDEEVDEPTVRPPSGAGGSSSAGGQPTRPPNDGPFPEQFPSETPIDMPFASFCPAGGTFNRSIEVSDAGTLEALRGCSVIDGSLTIFGTNLSDLGPLSQLRFVTRALRIASYAGTLDGLEGLESVGNLTIENTSIPTLLPLQSLQQIGGGTASGGALELNQNGGLSDLAGLGSLQVVTSISISGNPSLVTLAGLSVPVRLESLSLRDNPQLGDLTGLENLQLAQTVAIENSIALSNLAGLSNLQATTSLALVNLPSLTTLELPIGNIGVFYLDNVVVTNLNGLSGLRQLESAIIQNNASLVEFDRLGSLEALRELSVINNSSLVRLPDFPGVFSVEQVYVRNNPLLAAGPSYPLVAEADTILISDNPSLTNLTGFRVLQRAREIDISRNPSLIEVDLGTLGSARSVRITCNTALPESSLQTVMLNVQGTVDVWGNQGSPTPCP
jgi:hypothetical protein